MKQLSPLQSSILGVVNEGESITVEDVCARLLRFDLKYYSWQVHAGLFQLCNMSLMSGGENPSTGLDEFSKCSTEEKSMSQAELLDSLGIPKPSICRMVVYNHPGSADGKYPPTQSPAVVQNVAEDGSVRLHVFGAKGHHIDEGITYGSGPGQWQWPARV